MRTVWLCRLAVTLGLAFLSIIAGALQANAQHRAKIEIVPHLPHSEGVTSVAFSADGTHVLSGSYDKTIKLWDAASGALFRTFEGHLEEVSSVAFSFSGIHVLSGSNDATIKLWDAASGTLVRTFKAQSKVTSVAFSPDDRRILSGSEDGVLRLWDTATATLIRTFEDHSGVTSVAFARDGEFVLSGSRDGTFKLWDAATGALVHGFGNFSTIYRSTIAFTADGTHALSSSTEKTMKLWNVTAGTLVRTFEGESEVSQVAFSRDGKLVLSGNAQGMIRLWDLATGALVRTFERHSPESYSASSVDVFSVVFSPDGSRVLSGSNDKTMKLWDATTGALLRTFGGYSGAVNSVAVSSDGNQVLSGNEDGTLRLWDAATGALLRSFGKHSWRISSVAFSRRGGHALSGSWDGTVKLWETATGVFVRAFNGHSFVSSVAFSTDDRHVLSGSVDGTVMLWDTATGTLVRTFEGQSPVYSVTFSCDSRHVLSGGDDGIVLWDAATGTRLRTFKSAAVSVAFSPDCRYVLSDSNDSTLKLWDVTTGALVRTFKGHTDLVYSVAFSSDGTRVLSGSWDRTVKLWDAKTGALLHTFNGHIRGVNSVAFSPNGRRIISGGADTSVRTWDAATGAQLAVHIGGHDGQWLTIAPRGYFVASGKGAEMLGIVRGLEAYLVTQFYDHLHRPDLVEELLKGDPEGKYKDAARRLNLESILDSGPAPRIELLPDRTEKSGERIKLAVRLVDQEGGGIGPKVLWRVNGKTLGATAPPGLGRPLSVGDYVVMEQTLTVDPSKKNEVEIIAYNAKGLLATTPLRFGIDAWGVAEKERPRMFVLAVGVDTYAQPDWQLRYAAKDAKSFAEALKLVGSPLFSKVEVKTLLDAEVTERSIAAEFDRLAATVKARDVFVLFLGGHGRSIAGEGWFYIPQDFDLAKGHTIEKDTIGPGKLRDWLAKVPAEKSLVVLDACESGASEAFRGGDRERETVMAQLEYATGRNYITAAPAGKAAYEGHKGHGVLTYAILEALHRPKGAAADPVSVFGIATHISREVPVISQKAFGIRQQPRFTPTGDDFPLGVRTVVLKDAPILIPAKPTHVTKARLKVFKEANCKGLILQELQPFTPLALIQSKRGCAEVADDGRVIGHVTERWLQKLAGPAPPKAAAPPAGKATKER